MIFLLTISMTKKQRE